MLDATHDRSPTQGSGRRASAANRAWQAERRAEPPSSPPPSLAPACHGGGKSVLVAFEDREIRYKVSELVAREAEATAVECACAAECRDLLGTQKVNALLLDMTLPGDLPGVLAGDPALGLCEELRAGAFRPPILLFGRCREDGTAIRALDAGATDYLPLPFNPAVFLARLRAHLRHHDESDFVVYKVGPFDFRPGDRLLTERESGRKLRLTAIETRIVRVLLQQPGAWADREDLIRALWGEVNERTSHAIDSHVYRMRQKIEPDPKAPTRLVTEGRAYRLAI